MKKSILALAVAALATTSIASTAASAATVYDKDGTSLAVYGRVQSVFYSNYWSNGTADGDDEDHKGTIQTSGRLGVEGRTQLFDGIAAFSKAEWDVADSDGKDSFAARYLWVGLDFGQYGEVKVGKFEEAIKYAISPTDFFEDAGCTGLAGNDDKREGVLQYKWSGNGVDAIFSYAVAKNDQHLDGAYEIGESVDLDYSVSAALGYSSQDLGFGPFGVRLGFAHGEFADANDHARNFIDIDGDSVSDLAYDDYNQFAVSAFWGSLDVGPYVAAVYQQRKFGTEKVGAYGDDAVDLTVSGWEFTVAYTFDNGVQLATGYEYQKYKADGEDGGSVKAATIPLFAMWRISPRFEVWTEARFDVGTDDDADDVENGKNFYEATGQGDYSKTVYSAGLRYKF